MKRLVASGDVHGDFVRLCELLKGHKLIGDNNDWIGGDATLVFIGDLMDRVPKGVETIRLVMKLELQAEASGGKVVSLCGNHELMFLAMAYQHRGDYNDPWLPIIFAKNGGDISESLSLSEDVGMFDWMLDRPLIYKHDNILFQHVDSSSYYRSLGATIEEINESGWKKMLNGIDVWQAFSDMCNNRYWNEDQGVTHQKALALLERYLHQFDVDLVVHGHTGFIGQKPLEYMEGMAINIDGAMSSGYQSNPNRGFLAEFDEFGKLL